MTMTADSLLKVAEFMPHLEKIYLDDVFNDSIFSGIIDTARKTSSHITLTQSDNRNDLLSAWEVIAKNILKCPIPDMKLRYLSLPGCAINDEIMEKLAPALVT